MAGSLYGRSHRSVLFHPFVDHLRSVVVLTITHRRRNRKIGLSISDAIDAIENSDAAFCINSQQPL